MPTLHARENLAWSHYRALLGLPPDKIRHYEELADEQAWTTRQLKQAIEGADACRPHGPAIDLGFYCAWVPDEGLAGFDKATPGDVVTLDPVADLGLGYRTFSRLRLRSIDAISLT